MSEASRLWQERRTAHLKTVSRYMIYVGRSGFFLFLLAAILGLSYLYGQKLVRLPDTFPHTLVLVVCLTPFIAFSPVRTLLKEADLVFLLPLEDRIGPYFRGALLYSGSIQSFVAVLAATAAMPLYRHGYGDEAQPFAALAAFALLLKIANLLGHWLESGLTHGGHRAGYRIVRWIATAALLAAWFRFGFAAAAAMLPAVSAGMFVWARSSRRMPVNWTYLLAKEAAHRTAMLLFFNMFIDVPELPSRMKPRRAIARLANLVPFRQDEAYRYLYVLTLIRSELFGIVARLTAIAFVLLLLIDNRSVWAGVFILFQAITGMQLSTLGRYHRHSVWPDLYPMPNSHRAASAAAIAFIAHLAQTALLTLPMLRPAVFAPWMVALPLAGSAVAFVRRRRDIR